MEMFYLNSTLNFGILPVFVFQLEVYYKVDRLLTGLTAQLKGTTARWYSNKTSLSTIYYYYYYQLESINMLYSTHTTVRFIHLYLNAFQYAVIYD